MANNFKPWVDAPTAGQQVQSAAVFEEDEQRINGFKAGDPASALRVNSALRQANIVIAGLMQFCDEVKTLPTGLSLMSTVTQVKNAIKDSIDELHDITLTNAKDYTDERETAINSQITNVQTQVTSNENDITTLVGRVDEHDDEIAGLSGGASTLTTRVGTLEQELDDAISGLATVATSGSYDDLIDPPSLGSLASKSQIVNADVASNAAISPSKISGLANVATSGSYNDLGNKPYDLVIRTQSQFEDMIRNATWLDAKSVALVGQFTYSETNNSGIKIPSSVKQIHGYNGAKIIVTNFVYDETTAKGGLWYDTVPMSNEYEIRNLEVDCTGTGIGTGSRGYGFRNCMNLTDCTGTGTGVYNCGFGNCTNLMNCTGTGTGLYSYGFTGCTNLTNCIGTGTGDRSRGFYNCTNLANCTGTGTGTSGNGYGFGNCTNLMNCTGTGTGTSGYGFHEITTASNCKDDGSSTNMWGGVNKNIDINTCRRTPVQITPTELTTLNV